MSAPALRIHLVCCGKEQSRKAFQGEPLFRPLSEAGREQALAIAGQLSGEPIARVVCGPELAAQQTVEPLALDAGLSTEVDERLQAGASVQRALELFPLPSDGTLVLCAHAELILALLQFFELDDFEGEGLPPCRKGSIWLLEGLGPSPSSAHYIEPARAPGRRVELRVEREEPSSVRAAVIDLGSTSFALLIADVNRQGDIRRVVQERSMLRLGAAVGEKGLIPKPLRQRATEVALEMLAIAHQEKVQRVYPVATSALRDAHNGSLVAARISKALETPVRVLSGEEEARIFFRGIRGRVPAWDGPALGIDLGGGSLEFAIGKSDRIEDAVTVPLGVTRLHRELVTHDPMRNGEARKVCKRVRRTLEPYLDRLGGVADRRAFATGGTARALVRMVAERRAAPGGRRRWPFELHAADLTELREQLRGSTHAERLAMRGMKEERADLLETGALIFSTVFEELELETVTVTDWGLREGVLLDAIVDPGAGRG